VVAFRVALLPVILINRLLLFLSGGNSPLSDIGLVVVSVFT
jgi:hypothetical protein